MTEASARNSEEVVERFLKDSVLFLGPDEEIMLSHAVSEITDVEKEALKNAPDADTQSIIRARIETGCQEAFELVEQMGAAPGAKWGDLIVGVFSVGGDLSLGSMGGVLLFSVLAQMPVRFMVKYWQNEPTVGLKPGDIFIHNDTRYGNVHNADFSVIIPIFAGDQLVCFAGCIVHEGENGATEPGGIPPSAESPFDEGLRIPPMRVGEDYKLRKDIVTFLQHSTREPKLMLGGLKSRMHACFRVQERVDEAVKAYGRDAVIATIRQSLIDTEVEARRRLRSWPDGTVRSVVFTDTTLRENNLAKIAVEVTKKDDELTIDFHGSAPEFQNRSVNTIVSALKAMLAQEFLSFVWPDMPRNQAVFAPITVKTDEGSLVNCTDDAATAQSMMSFFPAFGGLQAAIPKLLYAAEERQTDIIAPWWHMIDTLVYAGYTQHGEFIGNIGSEINGMPGGARSGRDGQHALSPVFAAYVDTGEQELIEEEQPMLRLTWQILQKDVQGAGKHRGGHGCQMITTYKDSPLWAFITTANASKFPSCVGVFGGYASGTTPLCKVKNVNIFELAKTNPEVFSTYEVVDIMNTEPFDGATYSTHHMGMTPEMAQPGELYMTQMGGGAGYGDVLDRDPALVAKDYREKLVSVDYAARVYGVVLDPQTSAVDKALTDAKRTSMKKDRLARAKPYAEFVKSWETEKPPADIPYFGSWGNPDVLHRGTPDDTCPADAIVPVIVPNPHAVEAEHLKRRLETVINQGIGNIGHTGP